MRIYDIDSNYYYVYEHWLNDKVIYVGKGKGKRAFSKDRNHLWTNKVESSSELVEVVIKGYFRKEEDALFYEKMLIKFHIENNVKLSNIIHNTNLTYNNTSKEIEFNHLLKKDVKSTNHLKNEKCCYKKKKYNMGLKFNHYNQVLSGKSKQVRLNDSGKIVIFYYFKDKKSVERLYEDSRFTPLTLSNLAEENDIWQTLKEGFIPYPYNTLMIQIEHLDSYDFKINDCNLEVLNRR